MKITTLIFIIVFFSLTTFGQVVKTENFFKTQYYDNGDIKRTAQYIDSSQKTIVTTYYEGSVVKTISILDSLWSSIDSVCANYQNGQLAYKLYYGKCFDKGLNCLLGDYLTYYENGQVKTSGQFYNNFLTGNWIEFNSNGDTIVTGHYVLNNGDSTNVSFDKSNSCYDTIYLYPSIIIDINNKSVIDFDLQYIFKFSCSKKHSLWTYYGDKGIVVRKENYYFGTLINLE